MSEREGTAPDSRVLCDMVIVPSILAKFHLLANTQRLIKLPNFIGHYYLCDGGYTDRLGFLTPYRGVLYHLDEWSTESVAQNLLLTFQFEKY